MNQKQHAEMDFWVNLCKTETAEQFKERRKQDYSENIGPYEGKINLSGKGLEVGTGCFSQLEWVQGSDITSIDPLNDEFAKILKVHNKNVKVLTADGENIPFDDETFDWVICWNVIDHTPNPQKMVDEIFRVLKPGGKLYFEVHFDDSLAAPHYDLWNEEKISQYFMNKRILFRNKFRNDAGNQFKSYIIFEK